MIVVMFLFKNIFTVSILLCTTSVYSAITVKVIDINRKPIAGIVVYLLPLDNQKLANSKLKPVVVNQSNKKFKPYIVIVGKGMPINFSNMDDITHQIYSASTQNRFSFRIKRGANKTLEPLLATGKVLMGCNIHDWMSGYLMVVDTPLYSQTNSEGTSRIEVTETGRYQLVIWHPQLAEKNHQVIRDISISEYKFLQVKLTKEMAKIPKQENPDGFDFIENY